KAPPRPVQFAVAVLEHGDRVWITRRPEDGLLGGLWEFPAFPLPEGAAPESVLEAGLSLTGLNWAPLCTVQHTYTHLKATMQVLRATLPEGAAPPEDDDRRWVPVADLDAYAFSNANQKIRAALDDRPLFRISR